MLGGRGGTWGGRSRGGIQLLGSSLLGVVGVATVLSKRRQFHSFIKMVPSSFQRTKQTRQIFHGDTRGLISTDDTPKNAERVPIPPVATTISMSARRNSKTRASIQRRCGICQRSRYIATSRERSTEVSGLFNKQPYLRMALLSLVITISVPSPAKPSFLGSNLQRPT